jgi:hypothetical protein
MYSKNDNDGIFVFGVEIYCDPETDDPIHVVGELLGIYWEDQIWIVILKDEKKRWKYRDISPKAFFGAEPWRIKKYIPLKWLEKNLLLYAKIPILNQPPKDPLPSPFFPRATVEFMKKLEKETETLETYYTCNSKFDYYSIKPII